MKAKKKSAELESPPVLSAPAKPPVQPRRRTKDGCVTCRKRRIKCGEEKPVCANCIKSKRDCTWYPYRSFPAPPPFVFDFSSSWLAQHDPRNNPVQRDFPPYGFAPDPMGSYPLPPLQTRENPNRDLLYGTYPDYPFIVLPSQGNHILPNWATMNGTGSFPCVTRVSSVGQESQWQRGHPPSESNHPFGQYPNQAGCTYDKISTGEEVHFHQASPNNLQQNMYRNPEAGISNQQRHYSTNSEFTSPHGFHVPPNNQQVSLTYEDTSSFPYEGHQSCNPSGCSVPHFGLPGTTQTLDQAAVEIVDTDYYDCYSDEDEGQYNDICAVHPFDTSRDLGAMTSLYHQTNDELRPRNREAFLVPGLIDHYRPERVANPLRNEATARVFNHFITSTGPMLSIFERRFKSTGAKSLWSATLPMMALHDQAVLHSLLALSSLHIAKLQGASTTPSVKHYAYALKQVRKAVASPARRHTVTTLAASLLIGFYEVMTAAHLSWSALLVGAKQLLTEVDLVGTTKRIRAWKIRKVRERQHLYSKYPQAFGFIEIPSLPEDALFDRFEDLDLGLLELLHGAELPYNDEGQESLPLPPENFTSTQLRDTEVLQDLYWWYIKQDLVYALISGNHLLLNFDQWSHCPPRAPMGLPDAVYGSADHLVILIGRTVRFIAEDRSRKIKVTKFPKMPFYGMAPSVGTRSMPPSFSSAQPKSPTKDSGSPIDLETVTAKALEEWNHLRDLYSLFEQRLGPAFQALSAAEFQNFDTPFGSGILYSNYDIAVTWMMYYMGLITLYRGHPGMPPAATVAIGAAARDTAPFATLIGRIGAGVMNAMPSSSTNAALGAVFGGCILPFFIAGVQLQDARQRHWLVLRLREIEQHSGWASVGLCALGCETAWVQAAKMGRGPPYSHVCLDEKSDDIRVHGKGRQPNEARSELNDRGFVASSKNARLNFAAALLETEEDIGRLSLVELA